MYLKDYNYLKNNYQRYENDHPITPEILVELSKILNFDLKEAFNVFVSDYVSLEDVERIQAGGASEDERAAIAALIIAVQQMQEIVFRGLHEKPIDLYQIASSILSKKSGRR